MSRNSAAILEARPLSEELVSPLHYVKLDDSEKSKIKSAEIVPPKLGDKHFGKILIKYKSSVYKVG